MHALITGHTGFKGAWLTMMLHRAGYTVSGLALDPLAGSLYERARLHELLRDDLRTDIRDAKATTAAVRSVSPELVIHLAAQPLVRESYRQPRLTFETNVNGTMNVIEAVQGTPSVRAHLVITTDKVYRNTGQEAGYREDDPLGSADPYSTSKAMADLLTQSYIHSVDMPPTAIARGGNVIGGGDVSAERLVPDLVQSFAAGHPAPVRNPLAVRPWQHVIDCLDGYMAIVNALISGHGAGAWNIGPGRESFVTVGDLATVAAALWGHGASWSSNADEAYHEAHVLSLDPEHAAQALGWRNRLLYPESLRWVVEWHQLVNQGEPARAVSLRQLEDYAAMKDSQS